MAGRPQNAVESVTLKIRVPKPMVGYLTVLAKDFGWGASATDVAGSLVTREVMKLQEARFHEMRLPFSEPAETA